MAEVMCEGIERKLAELALMEDPLFGRLPPERRHEAVDHGLMAGQQAADHIIAAYGNDPEAIAAKLAVSIKYNPEPARGGTVLYLSEYFRRPPTITLHMHSLSEANLVIREHGLGETLGLDDISPVHLAHELYHHLEACNLITGTGGFQIETFRIGPLRLKSKLASVEEIAADRFAMAILGIKVPPGALKFLTIYEHNIDYAWDILRKLRTL
jgi:hypothetical protein